MPHTAPANTIATVLGCAGSRAYNARPPLRKPSPTVASSPGENRSDNRPARGEVNPSMIGHEIMSNAELSGVAPNAS
jgi:hypothetical protein